ncbi:MAG: hypothetical protein LBU40_01660 [Methanobrevibacter sp.]|nr:hypothetical protein [Methanobrevibacter sp.]
MECLFLDESGNMGIKDTNFIIISILRFNSINDSNKLKKLRNKLLYTKFKKEILRHTEIKFHLTSNKFKKLGLKKLNELDFKAYSIVMDKNDLKNKQLLNKHNSNEIYMDMVIELLKMIDLKNPYILRMDKFLPRKYIEIFDSKVSQMEKIYTNNSNIYHNNSANI